jgi:S1-C subfamily serine protease
MKQTFFAHRVKPLFDKHSAAWWVSLSVLTTVLVLMSSVSLWHSPKGRVLTQDDINAAVIYTLSTQDLPSRTARAAAIIAPSVVHVSNIAEAEAEPVAMENKNTKPSDKPSVKPGSPNPPKSPNDKGDYDENLPRSGVGSGVVVSEDGKILTNWHVVQGAKKIIVTFFDGTKSEATLVGVQADNDLAVLQAKTLPDDLVPATLGSSGSLLPGNEVVAVGFPFGIGPSVSAGVVSGLNRQFRSEGKTWMKGLIQADAAANPGNSGGPMVNMQGEVVGIVTAILNPTQSRTFIGIVFAATIETAGASMGIPPF